MGKGLVKANLGWVAGLLGDYPVSNKHFEQSIKIAKQIGDIYSLAFSLINLSLFTSSQLDFSVALEYIQEAETLMQEAGHKFGIAIALTYRGHIELGLENYNDAKACYQQALEIRQELKQTNLSMEPLAGIAEIEMRTEGAEKAFKTLEKILGFLDSGGSLDGIDQPYRILTTCCRILLELNHSRANQFIQDSYQQLLNQANRIKDKEYRQSFINNVPCHQEMIRLYNLSTHQNSP
jgi:tetratricopeptide (TPR) repeat protein